MPPTSPASDPPSSPQVEDFSDIQLTDVFSPVPWTDNTINLDKLYDTSYNKSDTELAAAQPPRTPARWVAGTRRSGLAAVPPMGRIINPGHLAVVAVLRSLGQLKWLQLLCPIDKRKFWSSFFKFTTTNGQDTASDYTALKPAERLLASKIEGAENAALLSWREKVKLYVTFL